MDRVRLKRKYILLGSDQTDIPRRTRRLWKKRKEMRETKIDQPNQDLPRAHASSDAWISVSEPSSERLSGTTEEVNVTDDDSEPWVPLSGQQGLSGAEDSIALLSQLMRNHILEKSVMNSFLSKTKSHFILVHD
ncbi:hypothetical protein DPEC_G00108490 [Dallia pectoralis]|uniref:Uncharacterized protein n=1 Tax=Dallia pectoralis TaxID=75939 RepID=A0ACC2GSI0_DALPE|nr:hypothetical protein DPEC_G00108490 [Dallia pectoralis]